MVALVFGQALKAVEEGTVQFHSFPSGQPALGTSQPRDALVGQVVPVAPEPEIQLGWSTSVSLLPGMEQVHQDPGASCSLSGSSLEVSG